MCTRKKMQSQNSNRNFLTSRQQNHMLNEEFSHNAVLEDAKASKKQLQCSNTLKSYRTNSHAQDFDIDAEFEEKMMLFALEAKAASRASKEYMLLSKRKNINKNLLTTE